MSSCIHRTPHTHRVVLTYIPTEIPLKSMGLKLHTATVNCTDFRSYAAIKFFSLSLSLSLSNVDSTHNMEAMQPVMAF